MKSIDASFNEYREAYHHQLAQINHLIAQLYYFDEINSTNTFLLSQSSSLQGLKNRCNQFIICIAHEQTHGRGRADHAWIASKEDMIFSLGFMLPTADIGCLSLMIAILIAEAVIALGGPKLDIKWPNDLYYQNKKCGGILVESLDSAGMAYIVIGVGLNGCEQINTDLIQSPASSLFLWRRSAKLSKIEITSFLINHIILGLVNDKKSRVEVLIKKWPTYDFCYGKKVKIIQPQHVIMGIAQGIDENGYLQLLDMNGDGRQHAINSGSLEFLN